MSRHVRCPDCGGSLEADEVRCMFRCRNCGEEFSCQYLEHLLMGEMSENPDECMNVFLRDR